MRSATKKKTGRDPAYLAWIRKQPCAAKGATRCSGPIAAHHAGSHGISQKAGDRTAIPLCAGHHQFGYQALHVMGKAFWTRHGLDRIELIANLNLAYELREAA